jgi:hypothetical protein
MGALPASVSMFAMAGSLGYSVARNGPNALAGFIGGMAGWGAGTAFGDYLNQAVDSSMSNLAGYNKNRQIEVKGQSVDDITDEAIYGSDQQTQVGEARNMASSGNDSNVGSWSNTDGGPYTGQIGTNVHPGDTFIIFGFTYLVRGVLIVGQIQPDYSLSVGLGVPDSNGALHVLPIWGPFHNVPGRM